MSGIRDLFNNAYRMKKCELDYFVAVGQPMPAAVPALAGGVVVVNVQFTNDSDFLWEEFNLAAYSAAGVFLVNPDYLVSFADSGSGRLLQDVPVHVGNVSGNGPLPYVLPEAKLMRASSVLSVTITNNTAVAANAYISLIGRKVFYAAGYNRDAVVYGY